MAYSNNLRATLEKYKEQFPKLNACLAGGCYQVSKSLSNTDKLILASIMCQDLAEDLDRGSKAKVHAIGAALLDFSPEIILLSVRLHIQIDRLVKHDLDEDPVFLKVLQAVNRYVRP